MLFAILSMHEIMKLNVKLSTIVSYLVLVYIKVFKISGKMSDEKICILKTRFLVFTSPQKDRLVIFKYH